VAVIFYADFECARCGLAWERIKNAGVRVGLRHFPVTSGHPRARAASLAAEAADCQGKFWEMVDLLFTDQGHLDPPHLWKRAERLLLDLDLFDADMQSPTASDRVNADFREAIRAGVSTTPTLLVNGELLPGVPEVSAVQGWAA